MVRNQVSSLKMDTKYKRTPIGDLPVDWEVVSIGKIAEINSDCLSEQTVPNAKLNYLDISSIESTGKISNPKEYVFSEAPSRARRIIKTGDILVSTVRPYLRAFARVRTIIENLIASTGFAVISPKTSVDGEYLYQYILGNTFVSFLKERMTGSNYPAVNASDIEICLIPIPPIFEQKKIADILISLDSALDASSSVIEKSKQLKKGLMQQLLTSGIGHKEFKKTPIGEIPKNWEVIDLGNIFKLTSGNSISIRSLSQIKEANSQFPVYGGNGIAGYSDKYLVENTVIVIGRVGEYCGSVYLTKDQSWISDNALYTKEILKPIDLEFMKYKLDDESLSNLRNKGGQPLVSQGILHKHIISLPKIEEQKEIAEILSTIDRSIEKEKDFVKLYGQLKSTLMQLLLTGKNRV